MNHTRTTLFAAMMAVGMTCAGSARGQAPKPTPAKPATPSAPTAPKSGLSSDEKIAIRMMWRHLNQAFEDLQNAKPDVHGDVSKLEQAIRDAMEQLHMADREVGPAPKPHASMADKGKSTKQIVDAVKYHLAEAQKLESRAGNEMHVQAANRLIADAQNEANAALSVVK